MAVSAKTKMKTKKKKKTRYRNCGNTDIPAVIKVSRAIVTMRNDKTSGLVVAVAAAAADACSDSRDPFHARITSIFFHAARVLRV